MNYDELNESQGYRRRLLCLSGGGEDLKKFMQKDSLDRLRYYFVVTYNLKTKDKQKQEVDGLLIRPRITIQTLNRSNVCFSPLSTFFFCIFRFSICLVACSSCVCYVFQLLQRSALRSPASNTSYTRSSSLLTYFLWIQSSHTLWSLPPTQRRNYVFSFLVLASSNSTFFFLVWFFDYHRRLERRMSEREGKSSQETFFFLIISYAH